MGSGDLNSRTTKDIQHLARISPPQARQFLLELVNLLDDAKAVRRFEAKFAEFLPWAGSELQTSKIDSVNFGDHSTKSMVVDLRNAPLFSLRDELRSIWTTSDLKAKEWRIFLFRADPTMTASFLSATGPPHPNAFQQIVLLFFKWAAKTCRCHNCECSSPYFLASRCSQKYCSEVCARPAQRSYKRDWWQKHGKAWRKGRTKKRKRRAKGQSARPDINSPVISSG